MEKTIKRKWIRALRSGKYKQGTGALVEGDRYCCLGVLCEVEKLKRRSLLAYSDIDDTGMFLAWPPDLFQKQCELSDDEIEELALMNDQDGKSFHEIADWIQENL